MKKNGRCMTDLTTHIKEHISGTRRNVVQEYAEVLNAYMLAPLKQGTVEECINRMDEYGMTKDDLVDALNCYSFGDEKSAYDLIPGKVKSALTTRYANRVHLQANQFAKDEELYSTTRGKRRKKIEREAPSEEESEESSNDDAMYID